MSRCDYFFAGAASRRGPPVSHAAGLIYPRQALVDDSTNMSGVQRGVFPVEAVVVPRRPWPPSPARRVIALLEHVLHAVANDRHHVAVVGDVGRVAEPAVSGNDQRAAFEAELGKRDIDDVVERVDLAVDAAAARDVDDRIAGRA